MTYSVRGHNLTSSYLDCDGLDLELYLCSEVLKLRSLHYGYWKCNEKPTIHNLRKSQQRYTDTLIALIPPNVTAVLDVGSGIGDVAHALANRGYIVVAISPDKNHEKYFPIATNNLSFVPITFEAFTSNEQYDLILMSESQNYFPTEEGFQQCKRYLKPNKYLLVSGIFRKEAGRGFRDVTNVEEEYLRQASHHGFKLLKRVDITKRVLPTLVLAHNAIQEHVEPVGFMIDHYLTSTAWLKTKVLRWLFWRQIEKVRDIFHYYQRRTSPSGFEHKCRYLRLLFQAI